MRTAALLLLAGCGGGRVSYDGGVTDAGPPGDGGWYRTYVPEGCAHEVRHDVRLAPVDPSEQRYGPDPAPTHVHLSFPDDPSTTAAFVWQTDDETRSSVVEVGTTSNRLDLVVAGHTFFLTHPRDPTVPGRRLHEVHVCGLAPGTTHYYRVGGPAAWSRVRAFRTAPAPGSGAETTFAVIGDCRNNHDIWGQVADAVEAYLPDFVVFTGDAVNWGSELDEWDAFFDYGESLLAATPFMPINGNHEANEMPYYAHFALPGNEQWFTVRHGDLLFVHLNDSPADPETMPGEQRDLLQDALSTTDATWTFGVHHKPAYSSSTFHGPERSVQEAWVPVFDEHHLDLDLAGHDHVYERTLPLFEGEVVATPAEGTVYTINGGAGASLYGVGTEPWTEIIESVHSYTIVTVQGRTLDWRAFRVCTGVDEDCVDGSALDAWRLEK